MHSKRVFSLDLSPVHVHDVQYLKDVKTQFQNCLLLEDKGYLSAEYQLNLFESKQVKLEVPMGKNQNNYKEQHCAFRKSRKRVETCFPIVRPINDQKKLCESFSGFKTRILSKVTTITNLSIRA